MASTSVAVQPKFTQVISSAMKRSKSLGLRLPTPDEHAQIKLGLEVNFSGSPFFIHFQFSSPLSGTFKTPLTPDFKNRFTFPPGLSTSYNTEESKDNDSDSSNAQYITIPPTSPFHLPPPTPRPFDYAPFSDPNFLFVAGDALCADGPSHSNSATFQEESDRIPPELDESGFVLNTNRLQGMSKDLAMSPTEAFSYACFDSIKYPHSLSSTARHIHAQMLPDVPVGCGEPEFEEDDAINIDIQESSKREIEESVVLEPPSKPKPSPLDLDRCLVVTPFEESYHGNRIPEKARCGGC